MTGDAAALAAATRGQALAAEGRWADAAGAFREAITAAPDDAVLRNNLAVVLFQGGDPAGAAAAFGEALARDPDHLSAHAGLAHARVALGDQAGAIASFRDVVRLDPTATDAHMALYHLLQVAQEPAAALAHQLAALERCRLFTHACTGAAPDVTILVLRAPGDLQTNVPLDLLFDRARYTLHDLYLVEGHAVPGWRDLPPYDIVFNAISESARALPALDAAARFIASQPRPSLNDPAAVRLLSRDNAPSLFAGIAGCHYPVTLRLDRAALASGAAALAAHGLGFPIVIRPVDSHAGVDLELIEDAAAFDAYLARVTPAAYFVAPFVDYRSADGLFRKYRVIFVEGEPYPCHLAISRRWMIHYLNADMAEFAWMRDEEGRFLADLASVFDGPRLAALRAIGQRCGLDYAGMDCAIDRDGRVLVFEIDAAMLVHLWDPIEIYPYKHEYVPRIFQAVERMVTARVGRASV